jgi:hypothetical protein
MEEKLIDKIKLENGLTLELFDRSKPVAGDRWLVSFAARVELEVKPEHFKGQDTEDVPFKDIQAVLGEKTTYFYEKKRNFIAETEKEEVLNSLKDRFLNATLTYLSSADFPCKLILKQYQQAKGRLVSWKPQ